MATNNTSAEVQESVASLYAKLVEKRQMEKMEKEERKILEKEEKRKKEEEKKLNEDGTKLSKKERRAAEVDSWKEVIVGLTGEDLEYSGSKSGKKKKYAKWIAEDGDAAPLTPKPIKKKKKNYSKDFEPEINMLKTLVADQNRFTTDLQKRFQVAAGPSTKDSLPLNKTLVELAAVLNSSRSNALGMLSQIGTMKRNVADLYMKQKKLDSDLASAGGVMNTNDLGLMGSSVAASIFDTAARNDPYSAPAAPSAPSGYEYQNEGPQAPQAQERPVIKATAFDPSTWEGNGIGENSVVEFEKIPKTIVVEWHRDEGKARFKAIRDDTGEEIIGCPVPTSDPSKLVFNEAEKTVKGQFDEVYKLEIH